MKGISRGIKGEWITQMLSFPSVIPERLSKASLGRKGCCDILPLKIRGDGRHYVWSWGNRIFGRNRIEDSFRLEWTCPFLKNFYSSRKQAELHHLIFEKPLLTIDWHSYFVVSVQTWIIYPLDVALVASFYCREIMELSSWIGTFSWKAMQG